MSGDHEHRSSKHKRHHKKPEDDENRSKKQHKHEKEHDRKRKHDKKLKIVDDDPDEDMWVEKNIDMDGEHVSFI